MAGVFIETHDDPDNAPSDGPNMVPIRELANLLQMSRGIDIKVQKDTSRGSLLGLKS